MVGDVLRVVFGKESALLRSFWRSRDRKVNLLPLDGLLVHKASWRRQEFRRRRIQAQYRRVKQPGFSSSVARLRQCNVVHRVNQRLIGISAGDIFWVNTEL